MLWTGNKYFAPSYISKSDLFLDPYGSNCVSLRTLDK